MKLTVKNFGALVGTRTFEFKPGINALVGPNGCGKSTVVGALFLASAGETINRRTLDDVITWGHSSSVVEFVGDNYSVTRELIRGKNSKVKFVRGGTELTRKAEVDDEGILSLFNISDRSQFRSVYFAEQFKAIDIFNCPDSKRLEMLSEMLGAGRFEKPREVIAQLSKSVATDKIEDNLLDLLAKNLDDAKKQVAQYTEQLQKLASSLIPDARMEEIKSIASAYSAEELQKYQDGLAEAVERIALLEKQLEDIPAPAEARDADRYAKAYRYHQLLPELQAAEKALESFGQGVSPTSRQLLDLKNTLTMAQTDANRKIAELQSRAQLAAEGKCPLTKGDICADLARMTDPNLIASDISGLQETLDTLATDMQDLDSLLASTQAQEEAFLKARSEYDKLKAMIEPLTEYADFDMAAYEEAVKGNEDADKMRAVLYEQLGNLKRQASVYNESIAKASESVVANDADIEAAGELLQKHQIAVAMLKDTEKALENAMASVKSSEDSVNQALTQNREADVGIAAVSILDKVRWLLHKDNLPRLLIADAREELNKRLKMYLDWFEFPYDVRWTSEGGINFINDIGEQTPASALSGGQQYILAVANRCAAADLLDTSFPFMVLDEPTTGLDDKNRELLADMLYKVSDVLTQRGISLIIPTHDEALLSNANVIVVG